MLEQALFTSVRGCRVEGYQLAARSRGIEEGEARELSRWGPAHDSLLDSREGAESVNFHRLESGRYCVSRTVKAGAEYSGRGGGRIVTCLLVYDEESFQRFAHNPFRLFDAALAAGLLTEPPAVPEELPAISFAGGASPLEGLHVAQMSQVLAPRTVALLVDAALSASSLALVAPLPIDQVVRGLFSLLPLAVRAELSFTTGLRFCASRPYRIQPLPAGATEQRQLLRQGGAKVFDLSESSHELPRHEWAVLVERALGEKRLHWLAGQLAEQHRVQI